MPKVFAGLVVLTTLVILLAEQGSAADDTSYRAAVVEYYPVSNYSATPEQRAVENVKNYEDLLSTLVDPKLDIVVFPEWTITQGVSSRRADIVGIAIEVPENSQEATPCDDDSYPLFFQELSCLANQHSTYLVANLLEKENCTSSNCASDGWNLYNTNVVFDRTGKVILKYRKFNPFGEAEMNITEEAETATFETDFGVTFGTFICFDILFEKPTLELVRKGVKHITFPTMWFSELPFLTALQSQEMFAIETDVVFLAAGANSASRGSGGSGIYQGNLGAVKYDIVSNNGNKVMVADVLKEWNADTVLQYQGDEDEITDVDQLAASLDNFFLLHDNISVYETYDMVDDEFEGSFKHGEMNCEVSWKITYENITENHYDYSLFYYSGVRSFSGVREGGIDVCAVVFCQDLENHADCAIRHKSYDTIKWPYTIEELTIKANFTVSNSAIQFPNTLLSSIRPLNRTDYSWSSQYYDDNKIVERTITLLQPQQKLLAFGIYGRDFARDSASSLTSVNHLVPLISLGLFYKLAM
ncbi:hypothetical protein Trydic_g23286 [Trypoxylus dichotomus]